MNVLVTGASAGIGACIARVFAEAGANIGIHYNSSLDKARLLKSELSENNKVECAIFQGDLTELEVQSRLVSDFVRHFGGIDILVNNAGAVYDYQNFNNLSPESWDKTFSLNVKAPFFLIKNAFESMKERGGGRIINLSSASVGYGSGPNGIHYTAAKAALESITLAFAKAGSSYNILVNSIRCGVINTDMHKKIQGYSEENFNNRIKKILLQRVGEPVDIANMALFLASKSGNFITGEVYSVSGGD